MSRWLRISLAALIAVGIIAVTAGCGSSSLSEIDEGESFSMGDLRWNVLYDRFLNPQQVEDEAYVTGAPQPGPNQKYFAEFLLVQNEGGDPITLPERNDFKITDTTGATYYPVDSSASRFTFPYGDTIEPDEDVPVPDSVAASGPTQGAMLLFLLDKGVTENRPLELHISAQGEEATIKLDL